VSQFLVANSKSNTESSPLSDGQSFLHGHVNGAQNLDFVAQAQLFEPTNFSEDNKNSGPHKFVLMDVQKGSYLQS
jgi:hypothetical protein